MNDSSISSKREEGAERERERERTTCRVKTVRRSARYFFDDAYYSTRPCRIPPLAENRFPRKTTATDKSGKVVLLENLMELRSSSPTPLAARWTRHVPNRILMLETETTKRISYHDEHIGGRRLHLHAEIIMDLHDLLLHFAAAGPD